MPEDPDLPLLFTREEAMRAGLSRHQIAARVRSGAWRASRRAHYVVAQTYDSLTDRERHLIDVRALLLDRDGAEVASHLSAAVALGWALPLEGAGVPTVTAPSGSGPTRRTGRSIVQVAGLDTDDVWTARPRVGGAPLELRCTAPARTMADLLRHLPVPDSVAIADATLRAGQLDPDRLARVLREQGAWPYATRAASAAALVDPRRESWLESYSFCVFALAGLPMPEPQVTILDRQGRFVARLDGWWDDVAVALEADGRGKYLAGAPQPGGTEDPLLEATAQVRRTLVAQNEREAALRELGVVMVRWGTHEIARRPAAVIARAGRARAQGSRTRFTGRVVRGAAGPALAQFRPGESDIRPA